MSNKQSVQIESQILDLDTVIEKIHAGEYLSIAADELLLSQLPAGNWIGGLASCFADESNNVQSKEKLFVTTIKGTLPSKPPQISIYDNTSISRIAKDAPSHGFTLIILPALSDIHLNYAKNASDFSNMFFTPIIGWVSGQHDDDINAVAKVGFGPSGNMLLDQHAVTMHVPLPAHQIANLSVINLFEENKDTSLEFPATGYVIEACSIDGVTTNLAAYIEEKSIDYRLPLIADYSGIKVNVSVKNVDAITGKVYLCAPIFKGVRYYFAQPVKNHNKLYESELKKNDTPIVFSFNCMQDHLYSEFETQKILKRSGPFVYGEIAYQLLNQTHVFMTLTES